MKYIIAITFLVMPFSAFADFTESAQFGMGSTTSVAWGDYYNDDDYLDMAVGNSSDQQNYLYVNNGDDTFTQVPRFGTGTTISIAWGDYNNDGYADMAVGNSFQNYLYTNDGDGTFTETSQFGTGNTYSLAWGDYDNDGDLDLAVGNHNDYQNYLYINVGSAGFASQAQFGTGNTRSVAWGDYDNDGDLDLAVGNDGQSYLYVNLGTGTFDQQAQFGTRDVGSVAWGDYDNDGDLDLAVGIIGYQQNYLYVNNGDGTFTEQEQFGPDENTLSIAWGDYDNDGDLDMAVGNYYHSKFYTNNGDSTFTEQEEFGGELTDSVAWGDYDNDGDLDLAVGNMGWEQNLLYVNNEDDNDYLSLYLVGHYHDQGSGYSNRDGIGAKVLVYEEGYLGDDGHLLGFREIEANGGFCGQDSIDVEFGLPNDEYVDVSVIWPGSGGTHLEEEWLGVAKGQHLTLHEGESTDIVLNSFEVKPDYEGIVLLWDVNTTGDTEIAGFNLYRSADSAGEGKTITSRDKLNAELITGESPYEYLDATVEKDVTYNYWLEAVDVGGAAETFGPVECTWRGVLPTTYALYQSRPNPAPGIATITFDLPETAPVTLIVYDLTGRKVTTVVNKTLTAGEHEAEVSGLAPGVYVYRLQAGEFNAASKMVVVGSDL
jgi:hypothetical protein